MFSIIPLIADLSLFRRQLIMATRLTNLAKQIDKLQASQPDTPISDSVIQKQEKLILKGVDSDSSVWDAYYHEGEQGFFLILHELIRRDIERISSTRGVIPSEDEWNSVLQQVLEDLADVSRESPASSRISTFLSSYGQAITRFIPGLLPVMPEVAKASVSSSSNVSSIASGLGDSSIRTRLIDSGLTSILDLGLGKGRSADEILTQWAVDIAAGYEKFFVKPNKLAGTSVPRSDNAMLVIVANLGNIDRSNNPEASVDLPVTVLADYLPYTPFRRSFSVRRPITYARPITRADIEKWEEIKNTNR